MIKQIVVNELLKEEKETVRQVLIESYQQYEHSYSNTEAWKEYIKSISSSLDNPNVDKILVAKSGDEILGTLQLFESSEKAYQKPELQIFSPIIRLLAVHPNARGLGVAQELLKAGISYAKDKGATNLYLHSGNYMHNAIRLYEWFGFKRDETKEYLKGDILVRCYRFDL